MSDEKKETKAPSAKDALKDKLEEVFASNANLNGLVESLSADLEKIAKEHWSTIESLGRQIKEAKEDRGKIRDELTAGLTASAEASSQPLIKLSAKIMRDVLRVGNFPCPYCKQGSEHFSPKWILVSYPPLKIRCTNHTCEKEIELPDAPSAEEMMPR